MTYNEKAVEPQEALMDEYAFFSALAQKIKLKNYPLVSKKEYLTKVIEPLKKNCPEMSLEYLKYHYFTLHQPIAWENQDFLTPSGKFEILFNPRAFEKQEERGQEENEFRLLTNHSRTSLSSQHFIDTQGVAKAYINSKMAAKQGLKANELVLLESNRGKIKVELQIEDSVGDDIIMMYVGWWKKHGNPNWITESGISDIGGQVTYHETFVKVHRLQ